MSSECEKSYSAKLLYTNIIIPPPPVDVNLNFDRRWDTTEYCTVLDLILKELVSLNRAFGEGGKKGGFKNLSPLWEFSLMIVS